MWYTKYKFVDKTWGNVITFIMITLIYTAYLMICIKRTADYDSDVDGNMQLLSGYIHILL